ncbi:MAG: GLUG motif-containing protein, partial [Oscillospiraceae bacterium]
FGYIANGGSVQNLGVTGNVIGSNSVGGVVGYNNGTVQNCYSTVNVSGTENVGGVVGENYTTVKNCYSTGTVTGSNKVGGVVGYAGNGSIQNCYSTGTVTGGTSVGGVVGKTNGANVKVLGCVSLGSSVMCSNGSTATNFGRVVGLNEYSTINNNKARSDMLVIDKTVTSTDVNSTNGADIAVGTGTKQTDVFASESGWDASVWEIPSGDLVLGAALPTLKGFNPDKQNPKLPAAAEREIPLETGVSSLETDKTYTVANATQL